MRIRTNISAQLLAVAALVVLSACNSGPVLDGDQKRFVKTCSSGGYSKAVCGCAIDIAKDNLSPDLYAAVLSGREGTFPPLSPAEAGSSAVLNTQAQINKEIILYAYTVSQTCGLTVPLM